MSPFAEHVMNGKHLWNPRFLSLVISTDHSEREGSLYPPIGEWSPHLLIFWGSGPGFSSQPPSLSTCLPTPMQIPHRQALAIFEIFQEHVSLLFLLPQTLFPLLQLGDVKSECFHSPPGAQALLDVST